MSEKMLTSTEAAARLGIKIETLYAYVSRGVLRRHLAPDGKESRFDRREVDQMRARRSSRATGEATAIVASRLTRVDDEAFCYRGRLVSDLVAADTNFEAAAQLLWSDTLEGSRWKADPRALSVARTMQSALPETAPTIDRIRATLVATSALDTLRHDLDPAIVATSTARLIATIVESLPGRSTTSDRLAARLWPKLTRQRASVERIAVLNAALVAVADHDLAASTYAARIAASTRADPYAVIGAGLGALGGPLHGAASREVHELLQRAIELRSAADAVGEVLARGRRVPGFGHKVYTRADPRFEMIVGSLRLAYSDDAHWSLVDDVQRVGSAGSGRIPNVDLALGAFTLFAGMPADAGETVFAIARIAGWIAHAIEEYGEPALRYRPRSRYVGPKQS